MPEKKLTSNELETMIGSGIKTQLEALGFKDGDFTDQMKGFMKEAAEETVNNMGHKTPDFFEKNPRDDGKGGFDGMWDFCNEVYKAGEGFNRPSERMKSWLVKADNIIKENDQIHKAVGSPSQNASSLEAGGALIPPEFSRTALSKAVDRSTIMQKAKIIPMQTDVIQIPFINSFDKSQGLTAGNVKFRWVSENEQDTGNQVKFKMVTLTLREATALVYVSRRLMDFSPMSIQPFITDAVDEALDTLLEDVFISGTGAGQPMGVMNSDPLVTIAKESGQTADTIVTSNITKMFSSFYGKKGTWYANSDCMTQLSLLSVDVGTGGSAVGLLRDMNIAGALQQTMLAKPIQWSEYMALLGDTGDIGLFDWTQYLIGQLAGKGGMMVESSPHLKFDYRQNAFQFVIYIDGQPWWPESYKPRKGTEKSPFTVIAAR